MESLEARWVFSATALVDASDAGVCLPETESANVAAESELAATLPIGPAYPVVPGTDTQLAQQAPPSAVDLAIASLQEESGAEGEASYFLHLEMTATNMGNRTINFSGSVTIDGPVGSVVIQFGGLLSGHSTTVDQYGQFSYSHTFASGTIGQVTGQAASSLGYESNVETEFIFVT